MDSDDESEASVARGEDDPRMRLFYVRLILILIFITSAGEEDMEYSKTRKRLRSREVGLAVNGGNETNTSDSMNLLWEEADQPPEPIDEVYLLKQSLRQAQENRSQIDPSTAENDRFERFPRNVSALFTGSWKVCGTREAPCEEEGTDGSGFPFHTYQNRSYIRAGFGGFQGECLRVFGIWNGTALCVFYMSRSAGLEVIKTEIAGAYIRVN